MAKKKQKVLYLSEKEHAVINQFAKVENRSVNNFITNSVLEYIHEKYEKDFINNLERVNNA